jgi:hypothetical protein
MQASYYELARGRARAIDGGTAEETSRRGNDLWIDAPKDVYSLDTMVRSWVYETHAAPLLYETCLDHTRGDDCLFGLKTTNPTLY